MKIQRRIGGCNQRHLLDVKANALEATGKVSKWIIVPFLRLGGH